MRCHICDHKMEPSEIIEDSREHGGFLPCYTCRSEVTSVLSWYDPTNPTKEDNDDHD